MGFSLFSRGRGVGGEHQTPRRVERRRARNLETQGGARRSRPPRHQPGGQDPAEAALWGRLARRKLSDNPCFTPTKHTPHTHLCCTHSRLESLPFTPPGTPQAPRPKGGVRAAGGERGPSSPPRGDQDTRQEVSLEGTCRAVMAPLLSSRGIGEASWGPESPP